MGWELEDAEKPFVAQLQTLGWVYTEVSLDTPALTGRVRVRPLLAAESEGSA